MFWFAFSLIALVASYFAVVRPALRKFKPTAPFYARVDAAEAKVLAALKTPYKAARNAVLGTVAVGTSAFDLLPPDALQSLHDVDWSSLVSAGVAVKITSIIMIVMVALHVVSVVRAVVAPKAA